MRAFAMTGIDTALMMPSIRSGSDMRATPLRSRRRRVEHRVVDVEVLRRRVPPGQPEQPDQRAAAHRQRVAYRVVVHLPGQRDPPAGLDDAVERLGHRYLPQLPGEVVL